MKDEDLIKIVISHYCKNCTETTNDLCGKDHVCPKVMDSLLVAKKVHDSVCKEFEEKILNTFQKSTI